MKSINDIKTKRVNMNLPVKVLERLDKVCEEMSLDRTSMVKVILKQYLDQQDALNMTEMFKVIQQQQEMQENGK